MSAKLNSYVSLHGFTAADKRSCVLWVKHVNGRIKEKDRRDDLRVVCSSDTYSTSSEASSWVSGRTERAGTLRPGRSGCRQLRSLARDRTLRHAHPGNLGAGSRRRAVINQGPERRQVNGRGGERTKVMGRDTEERDRESGGGREGGRAQVLLSKPHSSPAKPPFLPLPLKSIYSGTISPLWTLHS